MDSELLQNIDVKKLDKLNKKQLVDLIVILKDENATLKKYDNFMEESNAFMEEASNFMAEADKRMESYERNLNLHMQYNRRESVEITGIPETVENYQLEDQVINIYNAAGIHVHGRRLNKFDITACHRLGSKGKTIVSFVNRKFTSILYHRKALRNHEHYRNVYINNSFTKEFAMINFYIRNAYKNQTIISYKVKHGINYIQLEEGAEFHAITHRNDLSSYGIVSDVSSLSN